MDKQPIIQLQNITKAFGKIVANRNVTMDICKGEILSVLGDNGCGKTMKIQSDCLIFAALKFDCLRAADG